MLRASCVAKVKIAIVRSSLGGNFSFTRRLVSLAACPSLDMLVLLIRICLHTRKSEIPIRIYSVVQTGPKTQFGGVTDGFTRDGYQSAIDCEVRTDPTSPAANGMTTETTRRGISPPFTLLTICFNGLSSPCLLFQF